MNQARLTFTVTVDLKRKDGKEETTPTMAEEIRGYLEDDADPGSIFGPNGGEYEALSWAVTTP